MKNFKRLAIVAVVHLLWGVLAEPALFAAQPQPRGKPPTTAAPGGRVLAGHESPVTHVVASADARILASAGLYDKSAATGAGTNERPSATTIRLWDAATGKSVRQIEWRNANLGYIFGRPVIKVPPDWTPVLAMSCDGKWIAAAEEATPDERKAGKPDAWVRIIAAGTGKDTQHIEVRNRPGVRLAPRYTSALAFSPDSKHLAVATWAGGGGDPAIDLWEVATGKHLRTLTRPKYGACCLAFAPDGKRIAFTNGRLVGGADLPVGEPPIEYAAAPQGSVRSLAFSCDSARLVGVGDNPGQFLIWDGATGKILAANRIPELDSQYCQRRTTLSATAKELLIAGHGARLFDLRGGGGLAHVLTVGKRPEDYIVHDAILHPDGLHAILACGDGTVRIESLRPADVKPPTDAKSLEAAWESLGDSDARAAYRATWAMALSGDRAVKLLATRLDQAVKAGDRDLLSSELRWLRGVRALELICCADTMQLPGHPGKSHAVRPSTPARGNSGAVQLLDRISKSHPFTEVKRDAGMVLATQRR